MNALAETKRCKVTLVIKAASDTDILYQVTNILELNTETYTLGAIVSEEEMLEALPTTKIKERGNHTDDWTRAATRRYLVSPRALR